MTIASEITRLQWAKTSARTSIQSKGVSVPSNAKVDTYHTYIDQITSIDILSGVSLKEYQFSPYKTKPDVSSVISWNEWNLLYWLCCTTIEPKESNTYYYGLVTFRRPTSNSDVSYWYLWNGQGQNSSYAYTTRHFEAYRNGNDIRVFSFSDRAWSWDQRFWSFCYQFDWNISTNAMTTTYLWEWDYRDYNYADYGWDTTWYTQISWSTWVKEAVWTVPERWALYLKLK